MTIGQKYMTEWERLGRQVNPESDSTIEYRDGFFWITGTARDGKRTIRLALPELIAAVKEQRRILIQEHDSNYNLDGIKF